MFDKHNIKELLKPVSIKKETLEFQLGVYRDKFDIYKKFNFPELHLYEKKKETNQNIIPDKIVLQQFKEIEKEKDVTEFRKVITSLKRDINEIDVKIQNETKKLNSLFTFSDFNYSIYVDQLNRYYATKLSFNALMELIFANEFGDKKIYYEVAGLRNLKVLYLLYKNCPLKCRDIMMIVYEEALAYYKLEEIQLIEQYGLIDGGMLDLVALSEAVRKKYELLWLERK